MIIIYVSLWMLVLCIRCAGSIPFKRVGCEGALPVLADIARFKCILFHSATGDEALAERLCPRCDQHCFAVDEELQQIRELLTDALVQSNRLHEAIACIVLSTFV